MTAPKRTDAKVTDAEVAETLPNFLSEIIAGCRGKNRLRFRQVKCIATRIKRHKKGKALAGDPALMDAIREGLDAWEEREWELERDPHLMTEGPANAAARTIFQRLGMPVPDDERAQTSAPKKRPR